MERFMGDNEVPDDAAADLDSPGAEEESSAAEEGAETAEAAQAEGAEEKTPEKDEADEGEKGGESAKGSKTPSHDKLLAKYGGDAEKMAEAYFEQAKSSSRLHQRLQDIEKYIEGQKTPPVDEEKLIQEDPDVQALNEEFTETAKQLQELESGHNSLLVSYGKNTRLIANLEGQLKYADPDTAPQIRQELMQAKIDDKQAESALRATQRDIQKVQIELKKLNRQIKGAEQEARTKVSRQRQVELENQKEAQEAREEFVDVFREEAKGLGIDPASKTYNLLMDSCRSRIHSYLTTLPKGAPGIPIPEAVHALMEEYAEGLGLKGEFQKKSALKRAASPGPQKLNFPSLKPDSVAPPKDGRWTKAYVQERAKRMLGS